MRLIPVDDEPASTPARPRRLVPLDAPATPQPARRSWINPYGLPAWQDRPLTSKLLPPWSPLQLGFTPGAERFGQRMVSTAQAVGRVPGNIAEALIGRAQPRVAPPGQYPRVQRPSGLELGLRSAVPSALDALIGAPLEVATSLVTPRSLATGAIWAPAVEAATASRLANVPISRIGKELFKGPTVKDVFTKSVRPSVSGKQTASQAKQYYDRAERAVTAIADRMSQLALPDEAGNLSPRLPRSLKDFSDAIEQTKFSVFRDYDALQRQAGQQGAVIPTEAAARAAEDVVRNRIIQRYYPEIAEYARQWATRLRQARSHTPNEVQDLIAKMNADLDTYYRNPQPGSAARAVIDAGIANNLRRGLDQAIEHATGGQYQLLKNTYGALKTIEKDVNHRMIVFARQNKKGLIDFSDIFSGAEMVRGILTKDPATFATGAAAKGIAAWYKYINNPDQMVKRMFRRVSSRSAAPIESRGIITRGV